MERDIPAGNVISDSHLEKGHSGVTTTEPAFDLKKDLNIKYLTRFIFSGAIAIILVAVTVSKAAILSVIGLSFFVALASLFSGGFLGFIFGIPKVLQGTGLEGPSTDSKVVGNTNLEQISDWLTKIIVGVSLTQLPTIELKFSGLCKNVANGFNKSIDDVSFAYSYSTCLIIFFTICGFILSYVWARIYLLEQLSRLGKLISADLSRKISKNEIVIAQNKEEVDKRIKNIEEIFDLKTKLNTATQNLKTLETQRKGVSTIESDAQQNITDILATAKPEPVTVLDDTQKGRWGNSASDENFIVTARFPGGERFPDTTAVVIRVEAKDPANMPLEGTVYLFMHPSFHNPIIEREPVDGVVEYSVLSYEACTLGVVINGGAVKLELDLNLLPDAPEKYRYKDVCKTETELKAEITELTQKLKELE